VEAVKKRGKRGKTPKPAELPVPDMIAAYYDG
jgi:hypothetical protein